MRKFFVVFCYLFLHYMQILPNEIVYLSPSGSDNGKGTVELPYYSLDKALENRLSGNDDNDTLFVRVMGGIYYMKAPFKLEQTVSRPIVIMADNPEIKPCFSGGLVVKGWEKYGDKLYRAYIPEVVRYGLNFEQFYVNSERAVLSRTPNEGWNYVNGTTETEFVSGLRYSDYAIQRVNFSQDDWKEMKYRMPKDLSNIKFRFYHKWDITQRKPVYINTDSAYIFMQGKGMQPWNPIKKGSRYIMYDYMDALDTPGEWYLDREQGYLYYMPRENENLENAECFVPLLSQLVIIRGDEKRLIENISFRHIAFHYTSHCMPEQGEAPFQAAALIDAALSFDFVKNITLYDCEVCHTGGYAIWFRQACYHNRIQHCLLSDLGAGGIKIGEPYFRSNESNVSSHNVVDNNIILHAGRELPCGVGVAIFHSGDNKVTHNEIADLYYSGISVGWVWGYNQSPSIWTMGINRRGEADYVQKAITSQAVRNIIAYNHIHHIGWGELSDMGAVYTLGESEGTQIINNVIHDVLSYDYGGWGLYTDEGSSGVVMKNNLVYRCKSGGFHQHYGKENHIENNIFAFGYYFQAQFTRPEDHLSFYFRHNIILQSEGQTLSGAWKSGIIDIDYNLYWHLNGTPTFGYMNFDEWKRLKEHHSVYADPLFKDPLGDDYTFLSVDNVSKIGFKPFDYSKAGVYGTKDWRSKAELHPNILNLFNRRSKEILKK